MGNSNFKFCKCIANALCDLDPRVNVKGKKVFFLRLCTIDCNLVSFVVILLERERERQTDRQIQTDKQTDRERERWLLIVNSCFY